MNEPVTFVPAPRVPVAVGDITLALLDRPVGRAAVRRVLGYRVQIEYADGQHMELRGRLERLLDGRDLAAVLRLLDVVRRTAERKMLPGAARRRSSAGRTAPGGAP